MAERLTANWRRLTTAWRLLLAVPAITQTVSAQHLLVNVRPPAAPRLSDVVFSPRFLRPESFDVSTAFRATRAEWIYFPTTPESLHQLGRLPHWVGLTLNANPLLPGGQGYAEDFDGNPLVAPWMKSWGAKWVTTTHPESRESLRWQLERILATGARSIQFDDPLLQVYSARFHGGDFNAATQAGFGTWLRSLDDQRAVQAAGLDNFSGSYREFLITRYAIRDGTDYKRRAQSLPSNALWQKYVQSTVQDYFLALRTRLNEHLPHSLALSMNIAIRWPDAQLAPFFLTAFPDYLMAEVDIGDTSNLIAQVATSRSLEVGFVASIRPVNLQRNRTAIAILYALGAQPIVPWDVFVPDKPRYFGTAFEYGDLYRFVVDNAKYFDGYEAIALVAIVVDPKFFSYAEVKSLCEELAERNIPYSFVLLSDAKGRRPLTADRLRGYALVALSTPLDHIPAADRALLASLKIPVLNTVSVSPKDTEFLRPLVSSPDGTSLRMFVRSGVADSKDTWVIHLIDEATESIALGSPDSRCRRRLGLKLEALGIPRSATVKWVTALQEEALKMESGSGDYSYVTISNCVPWGFLYFSRGNT